MKTGFTLWFLCSSLVVAQNANTVSVTGTALHVVSVTDHVRDRTESSTQPIHAKILTATMDGKQYTLQEYAGAFGSPYNFEVGRDYPVLKVKGDRIAVTVPAHGYKGVLVREDLTVISVSEIAASRP